MKFFFLFLALFLCIFITNYGVAQVINAGIGGNNTSDLLGRLEKDVLEKKPDLVILMVGTNDLLNSRKMISHLKYEKQLGEITSRLKKEGIEVLMMSSLPVDSAYLYKRHDRLLYKESPNEIMEKASWIVSKVADENEALFLNLFEKFRALNLPRHNEDLFIRNPKNSGATDGVHPTALGYRFIAENIFQFLKEEGLLQGQKKIICFGDSITNGVGNKGGGTTNGENYPSFLSKRISGYREKIADK
ncbi:GDSL-type esterase/lipase family protein [Flammeovirgaceae bacterium SG7u.111]|nr:GDSL-type esterase/lipase family protein [Flammeovirgaceae bacterium SG7u.132]WPO33896.1 GDSL-type esterase/lipase family protein [Flammeovirgaceae bacterium SG7u.111]